MICTYRIKLYKITLLHIEFFTEILVIRLFLFIITMYLVSIKDTFASSFTGKFIIAVTPCLHFPMVLFLVFPEEIILTLIGHGISWKVSSDKSLLLVVNNVFSIDNVYWNIEKLSITVNGK